MNTVLPESKLATVTSVCLGVKLVDSSRADSTCDIVVTLVMPPSEWGIAIRRGDEWRLENAYRMIAMNSKQIGHDAVGCFVHLTWRCG